jgi:hypothetical protein
MILPSKGIWPSKLGTLTLTIKILDFCHQHGDSTTKNGGLTFEHEDGWFVDIGHGDLTWTSGDLNGDWTINSFIFHGLGYSANGSFSIWDVASHYGLSLTGIYRGYPWDVWWDILAINNTHQQYDIWICLKMPALIQCVAISMEKQTV